MSLVNQIKAIKDYESRLLKAQPYLTQGGVARQLTDSEGRFEGYALVSDSENGPSLPIDAKYITVNGPYGEDGRTDLVFNRAAFIADNVGSKPTGDKSALLKQALAEGEDLRPLYGEGYADAVRFKEDLGQYADKDQSMIIPANPVGYSGQFKFDPNFGTSFYRDLALQSGKALGLTDEQILKKGTEYFADKFASSSQNKGVIGFTDFGKGMLDEFAKTAGYDQAQIDNLRGSTLKPLYDVNQGLFSSLNSAARVESQSSGTLKGFAQTISKNPLLAAGVLALSAGTLAPAILSGTALAGSAVATGAIAGGTLGVINGVAEGEFSSILKNGFKGALQGAATGLASAATQGIANSVSKGLVNAGMEPGRLVNGISGAVSTSAGSAIGAVLSGRDIGDSLLKGAVLGGLTGFAKAPAADADVIGDGIDNSNMDLGKSIGLMDSYVSGAYSGLDGPAADNPANRVDTSALKVAEIQAQQPTEFEKGVKAALPQIAPQVIKGVAEGFADNKEQSTSSTASAIATQTPTIAPSVPAIDPYKGVGLIAANAYTRTPRASGSVAAKFDLQKALSGGPFTSGLIKQGIYGGR